ncbi:glycosyltransferase [Spiribacter sp. SSL99]|uniref:glycosyltransferase n=1 Tax=Spiribacter sp. SSL99 TaxID=1866884 RepID=UPI00190F4808|nr:glycosyltransferase [Spiribacter sp. SSL99]
MTETADRPLVTFALFAYNQEQYIREAVEGAFAQTYEPLEIILSDDCSTDRTFQIVSQMAEGYMGPHRVAVRRNGSNLGLAAHVNAVLENVNGEIVVLAAGDDISLPERTEISVTCLQNNPRATAALMSGDVIDDAGKVIGERLSWSEIGAEGIQTLEDLLQWRHVTFGAARAFRRNVHSFFGPLNESCPTEDTPILLRSLICGSNVLSSSKAIHYRRHSANLSGAASLKRMNTEDIYRQYRDDIDKAITSNRISDSVACRLRDWVDKDSRLRKLRIKIQFDETLSLEDVLLVMKHPDLSLRAKTKIVLYRLIQLISRP